MMEITICKTCAGDLEELAMVLAGNEPLVCPRCGDEFWSLVTVETKPPETIANNS